ncbi:hypothetical protein SAMN05444287_0804 [Octadecabacter temperatus]|uniref:Uncharacterized protein n=1 Tax=Octadecabacter temperatus TaxID=1458307 RepID=A0A0K0Y4A4_9RHOB|nr:hypothetical protein [Octadecabacter temperatus]AKS45706.1 hypothetical protein OSB_11500 [Octadecabacter temperatus]SIN98756.1 hypothetical protein SAMN05444287_0804 [Octadecabacter temperatus]
MRILALLPALIGLAACGGDTESQQQAAFNRATAAQTMLDEVTGYAPTTVERMPTSGMATFDGYATMRVSTIPSTDIDDVLLLGLTHLEVRFDQPGPVTGTVSDLDALIPNPVSPELQQVSGTITIGGNDSIIVENQWAADYEGDLSWASGGVSLDGDLVGQFQGNRTSDPDNIIKGTIAGDPTGVGLTDSGSLATVELYIYGTDTP